MTGLGPGPRADWTAEGLHAWLGLWKRYSPALYAKQGCCRNRQLSATTGVVLRVQGSWCTCTLPDLHPLSQLQLLAPCCQLDHY